jgi:hypothetical protein
LLNTYVYLQSYDGSVERTIDALLTDNLPLQLMKIDRSLKAVWKGKGGPAGGKQVGKIGTCYLQYKLLQITSS